MEKFRLIALTACLLGIIITIFNSLYPSEKFIKQVKMIFSLIFILSIIKPLTAGDFSLPVIGETVSASSDYYKSISDNTYDYFIRSVENNISASLESKLHENNIYPEEIETSINISDNGSISINEVKITLKDITEKFSAERCIAEAAGNETTIIIRGYKDESIG